jgi:hypothetical protein
MLFVFVAIKLWILQESKYPLVLQNQFVNWAVTTRYVSNSIREAPLCLIVVYRQHHSTQKSQILYLFSHHEPLHGQKKPFAWTKQPSSSQPAASSVSLPMASQMNSVSFLQPLPNHQIRNFHLSKSIIFSQWPFLLGKSFLYLSD